MNSAPSIAYQLLPGRTEFAVIKKGPGTEDCIDIAKAMVPFSKINASYVVITV